MTTLQRLNQRIDGQAGIYSRHPSVQWFNQRTGQNYTPSAYFCASGLSQAFDAIGLGKVTGGPFIWTVAWYQWCLKNLTRVSLANAQPGDIVFFKFPTAGDRGGAAVNHVTTYRGRSGTSVLVKGFNEGSGGTGGLVGNAAYHQTYFVAAFRTPWQTSTPKKEGFLMALSDAQQAKLYAWMQSTHDILTGYAPNPYVAKGASLPLVGARVRDIKDLVTGGGPSGEDKSLLREILDKLDDISARQVTLDARQAALEAGLLNLEGIN